MAGSSNILGLTSFLIPEMTDILKENDTRHPAYGIRYTLVPVSGLVAFPISPSWCAKNGYLKSDD